MPEVTMSAALNAALRDALDDDPRVLVYGQDVGRLGGVFRVTEGLQQEFGADRVFDTPIAEAAMVGAAVGLLNGFVTNLVRAELADRDAPARPEAAAASQAQLVELLATGRDPRFAAALAAGGPPGIDLSENFERLVDRVLDGLIGRD